MDRRIAKQNPKVVVEAMGHGSHPGSGDSALFVEAEETRHAGMLRQRCSESH
jgi:hypothetical protein